MFRDGLANHVMMSDKFKCFASLNSTQLNFPDQSGCQPSQLPPSIFTNTPSHTNLFRAIAFVQYFFHISY